MLQPVPLLEVDIHRNHTSPRSCKTLHHHGPSAMGPTPYARFAKIRGEGSPPRATVKPPTDRPGSQKLAMIVPSPTTVPVCGCSGVDNGAGAPGEPFGR